MVPVAVKSCTEFTAVAPPTALRACVRTLLACALEAEAWGALGLGRAAAPALGRLCALDADLGSRMVSKQRELRQVPEDNRNGRR